MENFLEIFTNGFWLIVVGILWGCTNPFMKQGSEGLTQIQHSSNSFIQRSFAELTFLFSRPKVFFINIQIESHFIKNFFYKLLLPLVLNLSGSLVFYWSLSHADVSLIVPVTNSITFLFTTLTSWLLKEQKRFSFCKYIF